jgi:UTP--glucose-1-phosphate uridylyltransferase
VQNKVPKLWLDDLGPASWPPTPELEWCPPGHGDLYAVLHASGLLDVAIDAGYTQAFVSNADNLGAAPDAGVAGWFAASGAPFAVEVVRRTTSDRKGGHFARRRIDGRIVLRETAQTPPEDLDRLAVLDRHGFASTNNVWFDLAAMRSLLLQRDGNLGLPFIRNLKTVDPADPSSPPVVQLECAMAAAVEMFEGATTIEVDRSRFIPVKTTNDLLVLRSDCYRLDPTTFRLHPESSSVPFVDLGPAYRSVSSFDRRFPDGVPSLRRAASLRVHGDWQFGAGVRVIGDCILDEAGGTLAAHAVLGPHPVETKPSR